MSESKQRAARQRLKQERKEARRTATRQVVDPVPSFSLATQATSDLDFQQSIERLRELRNRDLSRMFEDMEMNFRRALDDNLVALSPFQQTLQPQPQSPRRTEGRNNNYAGLLSSGPQARPTPPKDQNEINTRVQANVARSQKLLIDASNLLSRVIAGLEVTPDEAKALKARVDAGIQAFIAD